MFDFLKKLLPNEHGFGAIEDFRSENDKAKDYFFREIVASATPVDWNEKRPEQWRSFTIRDQDGSGSCVMQSISKLCEILYWLRTGQKEKVQFSSAFYKYRSNFPSEGMIGVNAFDIWREKGVPLEVLAPSQKLSEGALNGVAITQNAEDTAYVFKIENYVQFVPKTSFEEIASTIQKTGKGVMVWFRFDLNEWTDIPTIKTTAPKNHHSIVAVDYTLYKGKKYLVVEDSWGSFNAWKGKRLISEEFFASRNTFAAYPINFKLFEVEAPIPVPDTFKFKKDLSFIPLNNKGQISDTALNEKQKSDVIALQNVLKSEGFYPVNTESTGYYGAITSKAVLEFQKKYKVDTVEALDQLQGRIVGSKTRTKLNQLIK